MTEQIPKPRFGKTALELLDEKFTEPDSITDAYGAQFGMGVVFSFIPVVSNWTYRRPIFSGEICLSIRFIFLKYSQLNICDFCLFK